MDFKKIKLEFVRRGVSFAQVARALGVSRQAVQSVAARFSTSEMIENEIAKVIGIPVQSVFPLTKDGKKGVKRVRTAKKSL